jgi:hypothetical protein
VTSIAEADDSQANVLCKSCGLCCTGHLFIWAKLRPAELDPAESLGMNVFRSDPRQRGFSQPCPLWQGQCTVYNSPHYPHVCRAYQCRLLKRVLGNKDLLPDALIVVQRVMGMIHGVEALLSIAPNDNFRERLVERIEHPEKFNGVDPEFRVKAEALLAFYEEYFGVTDLVEK